MTAFALPHPVASSTMSPAALAAVRCLLQTHVRRPLSEPSLRQALRLLCDDAHRRGMRAEQVLVLLKQAWLSLPENDPPHGILHADRLARVVSLCIEEFYGTRH